MQFGFESDDSVTAEGWYVDDVVVEQGGGVNELDDRRQGVVVFAPVATGACRQAQEQRTQPLAATVNNIV